MFLKIFHDLADLIETVNSCLTVPVGFLVLHFFILNLFLLFNNIWSLVRDFESFFLALTTDGTMIILNYAIQSTIAHTSYSTTREAEGISIIVSKIINSAGTSERHREIFKNFLVQNQFRNLNFQNAFFVINWKLLLAVSFFENFCLLNDIKLSVSSRYFQQLRHI